LIAAQQERSFGAKGMGEKKKKKKKKSDVYKNWRWLHCHLREQLKN
jgi:hypothetical protein